MGERSKDKELKKDIKKLNRKKAEQKMGNAQI